MILKKTLIRIIKNCKIYLRKYFDSADRYFNFTVCRTPKFEDARDFNRRMSSKSRSDPANLRLVVESFTGFLEETLSLFVLLNLIFTDEAKLKTIFPRKFTIRFPCLSIKCTNSCKIHISNTENCHLSSKYILTFFDFPYFSIYLFQCKRNKIKRMC